MYTLYLSLSLTIMLSISLKNTHTHIYRLCVYRIYTGNARKYGAKERKSHYEVCTLL